METNNFEISGLIRAIQKHGPASTVQAHLDGLTKAEKALVVVDILSLHQQQGEVLGLTVTHIWENYVVPEKLWEHYDGGRNRFMKDVDYEHFVIPTLESVKVSQARKTAHQSFLESVWGVGWEQTIDENTDHSSVLSEHYLRGMAKLARNGMTLSDAQLVLQYAMKARISHPRKGVRTWGAIMVTDIRKVISAVSAVSRSRNLEPKECSPTQLITFLDSAAAGNPPVAEVEPPQVAPNRTSPPISPTPSGAHPDGVEIPTVSSLLGPSLQDTSATPSPSPKTPPPRAPPTPDPSPFFQRSGPVPPAAQHPAARPLSLATPPHTSSTEVIELAPASVSHQISSPGASPSPASTPAFHSPLSSPSPSAAPIIATQSHTTPTTDDDPSALSLRSTGRSTRPGFSHPDLAPMDSPIGNSRSPSNSPPLTPQARLTPRKRRFSEYRSGSDAFPETYIFQLAEDWVDGSPVSQSLQEQGFYKGLDVPQFTSPGSQIVIHSQLSLFDRFATLSEQLAPTHGFHTLLQQVLVQSPYVYLTALAAMKTTNHRLVSLPVPLITLPGSQDSGLMDSTFPFAQYIQNEKEVPCTRLLYPLNDATLRLGTSLSTQERVKDWWALSGGDLNVAASQLQSEPFLTVPLQAGELIAMPTQLLWSAEAGVSHGGSSYAPPAACKFVEVRYISLTPERKLDFDYWPNGSFNQISGWNRDLLAPTVTGWGAEARQSGRRFRAAVEMRGVWAIGDALLGLMNWRSPLVQLELRELFNAPDGDWFNRGFAAEIESRFNEKLASMVETLRLVHERAFGTEN